MDFVKFTGCTKITVDDKGQVVYLGQFSGQAMRVGPHWTTGKGVDYVPMDADSLTLNVGDYVWSGDLYQVTGVGAPYDGRKGARTVRVYLTPRTAVAVE